ncbi:hypothetical protein ILUMI_17667 [Ignelater luminosus]|uniref:Transmembrane protein 231 n=1 Tax=Ignelater luminosus TaxID=2038154 RepID=A0A8K0CP20_IGNLU|nr:hypothetical protein ILUMI_17667 [Ignelater luminosus]
MVVLEVYSKCLKVRCKTRLCSKATIFAVLTTIVSIIIPFIFAYNSRGFWIKHDTFYEQPDVKFWGEYVFNAVTNNLSSPIMCSTFPSFQDYSNFDKCSLVKVRQLDNNRDGKVDELQFNLSIETHSLKILSFYIMLIIDYTVYTVCPMQMQSAIVFQHHLESSIATSEINIIANIELSQIAPLQCHPRWKNHQYNYSFTQNTQGSYNYDINKIIKNYSKRNISTYLTNPLVITSTGNGDSEILLKLKIRYPENKIYYIPSFWQVMKWAWMQYFAIYIIFRWIIGQVQNYVFNNKLVLFYEVSPLKKAS